jgi:N-acetyl-gamma-glutamyl-phosphate reductase
VSSPDGNGFPESKAGKSPEIEGSQNQKKDTIFSGRAGGIRTHDPLHPMQVRYQTALQPVSSRTGRREKQGKSELASMENHEIAQGVNGVKSAIVGASGYTGQELLRLLLLHPQVELVAATSRAEAGRAIEEVFPRFRHLPGAKLPFIEPDPELIAATGAQVAFLALPHGVAADIATALLAKGLKIIDLSADFRLRDAAVYEEFYGHAHPAPALLEEAVYGLPEVRPEEITAARLIASPGCYPTSILLPLIPLLKAGLLDTSTIVANSMSGVSGAGKKADTTLLFCECNESARAYGVPKHRHLSEIEQELSIAAGEEVILTFIPHLIPVNSGIATTTTAKLKPGVAPEAVGQALEKAYADAAFVRLLGKGGCPDTKNVTRTNFIDIGWTYDVRAQRLILMSAEDNVGKGAGSQAVQSFNLMFGLPETAGLLIA